MKFSKAEIDEIIAASPRTFIPLNKLILSKDHQARSGGSTPKMTIAELATTSSGGAQAAGCSSDPAESSGDGGATAAGVTVSASGTGGAGGDTTATSTSSGTPEEGPFTSAGEETEYEAEPHAAIDARGGVVVTWLGFASYEGKVGYGLSEYLDQIIDGQPVGIAE